MDLNHPNMKEYLERCKKENRYVIFDGGMGTYLQTHGLQKGQLPETMNLLCPEVLADLAMAYLEAGANVINTNTFGANSLKFPIDDPEYPLEKVVTIAVENAVNVRNTYIASHPEREAFVALDLGPTGKLLAPMGDLSFDRAVELYAEVIRFGVKAGADCILIETMSDTYELKAAVLAAKENSDLPIIATVIYSENGKLLTGSEPAGTVALLEGLGVDMLGVNCGLGPEQMRPIIRELTAAASIPVVVTPNAGLPQMRDGEVYFDVLPDEFACSMKTITEENDGILGLGGCCGTTPDHIRAVSELLANEKARPAVYKNDTVVSSGMKHVILNRCPVIIGERINPTGKSKMKQALRDHNMEYLLREGTTEEANGAHILDVNVGLPEIDEVALLSEAVFELQSVTPLPLQIDTSDTVAMEHAMRIYNGKPMINSLNGKQEVMDAVFPLIKKYGGVVVALLLDEDGIPATAEGRIAIARKIYENADRYGVPRKDIVFDALVMTISTDSEAAVITLETVRRITEELGACSVLGVSNVSFGLPRRDLVTSTFYACALNNGLTAGIINPSSASMRSVYDSFLAVKGYDKQSTRFIGIYAGTSTPEQALKAAQEQAYARGAADAANAGMAFAQGVSSGAIAPGSPVTLSTGGAGVAVGSPVSGGNAAGPAAGASGSTATGAAGNAAAAGSDSGDVSKTPLGNSILKGLKDSSADLCRELLSAGTAPLDIINGYIVPALDVVGIGFEKGTLFLPQLLMSADAAKACFEVIKTALEESGTKSTPKGKVIMATVKGDIHDIGKNIVKVLLENYSFQVIDLGKDVPPEVVVETAIKENVHLIGLSALMTTTVVSMEETIKALHAANVPCAVVVGGAVLTQEYADMIGADAYCKDAMQTVRYAEKFFEEHPEYALKDGN